MFAQNQLITNRGKCLMEETTFKVDSFSQSHLKRCKQQGNRYKQPTPGLHQIHP